VRVAITGATGFLGRHLVPAALRAGHEVTVLVRPGAARPVGVQSVAGHLGDSTALHRLVDGVEAVIHLAAVGVQARSRQWDAMIATNVVDPQRLLVAAHAAGVERMVALGTCLEYQGHGKLPGAPAAGAPRCHEGDELEAVEPYGASKAAGGLLLRSRARTAGLPCWYLRLAAVYGPDDDSEKVLPAAAAAARENRPMDLSGGEQVREWIFVDDAVAAVLVAATTPPPDGVDAINVGTGEAHRLVDVAYRIFDLAGADRALLRRGALPYRAGEAHHLVMTHELARRALGGWEPKVGLDDGLQRLLGVERASAGAIKGFGG